MDTRLTVKNLAVFSPLVSGLNYLFPIVKTHSLESMPKTNENVDSPTAKMVRVPPRRGQIKAKIMTNLVRMVEDAARAVCSKVQVAEESQEHPSQPHDSSHA
ncbi:unnamed protein product [Sphenostylis stenocarpa]|uniref:Uncharacterized protein n=1 Tax=Sphenostylis stenocarpa TaxID=92480 RepID=A0AA86VZR4_9FABA|nr:unnamed protein product [Sphenostylis stenocarpa]